MEGWVTFDVKDGEADKPDTSNERTENRSEYVLSVSHRGYKPIIWCHKRYTKAPGIACPLLCLSQRSMIRHEKKPTLVIEHPTMKNGLRMSAPILEIYGTHPSMLI